MKRKIIFVNQATGYLTLDIVNLFANSGYFEKTELFAGEINIRPTLPSNIVEIVKTKKYIKKNLFHRIYSWSYAFIHLLFYVWSKPNNYELFLVTNPPMSIFIPLFSRKKFSILIYDIYPDTLVSQQVFKKGSFVVKWWERINIKVFNRAEHIFTISEDMKTVVSKYVESNKIKVIYNWGHNEHIKPVLKTENDFLKRYNIKNKFVVLYSGNIGMTHDIDRLVDVADKLHEDKRFLFVMIGEGGKKEMIKRKISQLGLENCLLLPFQPLEVLPYSMGAADVCVVTTDRKQSVLSIPSKTYSFMSVGAAFLCITDKNSELGRLVTNEKIGKCFDADETVEMADYLLQLSNNPAYLDEYKNKARQLSYDYTPENANLYLETYISGK